MTDLTPLPPVTPGRYRHYKGGLYDLVGVARHSHKKGAVAAPVGRPRHSETREPLVVYRDAQDATRLWVRPHAMFFEEIEADGRRQPRFTPVAD